MKIAEIKSALEKKGYHLEKHPLAGCYSIYHVKVNCAFLCNQPSKGFATIQLEDDPNRIVHTIDKPEDLYWFLP